MLDSKLPELQDTIATSKAAVADPLMIMEDELGTVMPDVGSGDDVPGGPYVNFCGGFGIAFENNQVVATLVENIAQRVKVTTGDLSLVATKANRITTGAGQFCTQVASLTQTQRAGEANTTQIVAQLYQLSVMLNRVQKDLQQHKLNVPDNVGIPGPSLNPRMPHGMPIENAALQLQIELQVVPSRLCSDADYTEHF
jgi:hypothetical protein